MERIDNIFGINVFGDSVMKERLPEDVYNAIKSDILDGKRSIDSKVADTVAEVMKEWAIEKGATHFTHWFQPMTGITAEKHDSFIEPAENGGVIMAFSGKELIKGEPDASSFPSGGLRATFEARGYTAWDPSSFAFVKDDTLCIPTAFCSYNGEALDKKTPLLRSMEAINKQALRIAHLFGLEANHINIGVGPEQEYFLIDKELAALRPDITYCGRTLIGTAPPKGQEMNDHYFGVIKPRVREFMKELDLELWKLGVYAKTEHNEAAPAQNELAPIFTTANIAADHNQLTMELMKKIADKHGLLCLLHEKPFAGVNGSGKHNNWSISTDKGFQFLKPGKDASNNKPFLLSLAAVISAVDLHQDLLRISISSAGNDQRLGGHEAPPAIVSIYLGDDISSLLEDIQNGDVHGSTAKVQMSVGPDIIPQIKKDTADRNRTSPFAFTGNRFEFRMLGSNASISSTNIVLNTIVADVFKEFADRLEKAENFDAEVDLIVKESIMNHKRIIFNGDGYSKEWEKEAENRGLLNLKSTPDAVPLLTSQKNISLFERHNVFTKQELESRKDIMLENYTKTVHIEALTLIEMLKRDVMPAISEYECELYSAAEMKPAKSSVFETETAEKLSNYNSKLFELCNSLEEAVISAQNNSDLLSCSKYYHDTVLEIMDEIRVVSDAAQTIMRRENWPYPSYGVLLFNI